MLTEAIKFVFQQATDLLKRRKDRAAHVDPPSELTLEAPEGLLDEQVASVRPNWTTVDELAPEMIDVRRRLSDYADGVLSASSDDADLLADVDLMRKMLESIYGRKLAFTGEQTPNSAPSVHGQVDVDVLKGEARAVKARRASSGDIRGEARVNEVESGAQLTGVEIDDIG